MPCLFAEIKFTFVDNSVEVPFLNSMSVLHIVFPLSVVYAALIVAENAMAMSLSVFPRPLVHISIGVREPALAVEDPALDLALVYAPILELESANARPPGLERCFVLLGLLKRADLPVLHVEPHAAVETAVADVFELCVPHETLVLVGLKD